MDGRAASIGLAVGAVLCLTACISPRQPPPPPARVDAASRLATRIDQAWHNSGLEGSVERPLIPSPAVATTFEQLADCIADAGVVDWSMGDGPDGPVFAVEGTGTVGAREQLAFFTCFANNPLTVAVGGEELTDAQLDYLYDYYRSWVIPCLAVNSITVTDAPTREQFKSDAWAGWDPYGSTDSIRSSGDYKVAVATCGSRYADLGIVDPYGVPLFEMGETTPEIESPQE